MPQTVTLAGLEQIEALLARYDIPSAQGRGAKQGEAGGAAAADELEPARVALRQRLGVLRQQRSKVELWRQRLRALLDERGGCSLAEADGVLAEMSSLEIAISQSLIRERSQMMTYAQRLRREATRNLRPVQKEAYQREAPRPGLLRRALLNPLGQTWAKEQQAAR